MQYPIWFDRLDNWMVTTMHRYGIPALRIALGVVFLWFGLLKVLGLSPVAEMVAQTHAFLPQYEFFMFLGVWEIVVGIGLILKKYLRLVLFLFWAQMFGTVTAPLFAPEMFFLNGNPFLLTMEGEFVVKNIVLITAGIAIGGHEVTRKK